MRKVYAVLWMVGLALGAGSAGAQQAARRIHAEVTGLSGELLQVREQDGTRLVVKLAERLRVTVVSPGDIAAIAPGAYVGTTAVPQPDGTLSAVEVHIFPDAMRGTGEGFRPMPTQPGNTMTNATVAAVGPGNTMTNATVSAVQDADQSRRMTLTYKGGEKVVTVAPGVPVVQMEAGDRGLLVAGAHISFNAGAQADGSLSTDRITVGKNGSVPPL